MCWPRILLGCQPSVDLGDHAQTPGFPERNTPRRSGRHLAGFRNKFRRSVIPNAAVGSVSFNLFHGHDLNPECLVGDHHLVNEFAFGAFKRAEVETRACRHDASEHHVSLALWANRALDLNVDMVGQGGGLWHDASLEGVGAQHSLSPVVCLVK
jgi:hypothetical protein